MNQESSIVLTSKIGHQTKVGHFTVIGEGAVIGDRCNIGVNCVIGDSAVIGDDVNIDFGVNLSTPIQVEDGVSIGSNVSFANSFMVHQQTPCKQNQTLLKRNSVIGAGAVIKTGVTIGERAIVGPGSVVNRSVPPKAIVEGNPAHIIGYAETEKNILGDVKKTSNPEVGISITSVKNVSVHHFPFIGDMRGNLVVGEFERTVPFTPKRYFMVLDVPSIETRGEHAHHLCHQFLICVKGTCSVVTDDGESREEFTLNRPDMGLYLPPMTWGIQYNYSQDAVLLVFASHYYDAEDYIRDYNEFLSLVGASK